VDQCVVVTDPVERVLDLLQAGVEPANELTQYFLARLAADDLTDGQETKGDQYLRRSLGGFLARRDGRVEDFERKIEASRDARLAVRSSNAVELELLVAARTGFTPHQVALLAKKSEELDIHTTSSFDDLLNLVLEWVLSASAVDASIMPEETLCAGLATDEKKRFRIGLLNLEAALALARTRLALWLGGRSLARIEKAFKGAKGKLGTCSAARTFVDRFVRHLSYLAGVVTLYLRLKEESEFSEDLAADVTTFSRCIREGYGDSTALAVSEILGFPNSRPTCHQRCDELMDYFPQVDDGATYAEVKQAVATAMTYWAFENG
jgi:hypothetical protein